MINSEEKLRYNRQIIYFGEENQVKLKTKTVLQIGAGGLGSPLAYYLVSAGIGRLIIYENDKLDLSNLGRQILYSTEDVGKEKGQLALQRLKGLNPSVEIIIKTKRFDYEEGKSLLNHESVDYIVDASDNFETKFLVNDLGIEFNIPFTIAGIEGTEGQLISVIPYKTACYRCLFGDVPENLSKKAIPVLSPTCGVVGSLEATEVIKGLLNIPSVCSNKLLMMNLEILDFQKVDFKPNPSCQCQR